MKYIIDAANNLTNKYTTRDPFELAKCLGIQLVFFPFKKIQGLIYTHVSLDLKQNAAGKINEFLKKKSI